MKKTVGTGHGMLRIGDSRDFLVTEWEVEKKAVMFFKMVYRQIHEYIREQGWGHPQTGDENIEDLYWERWESNGDKSQWAWWRFRPDSESAFVEYFCSLDFQTLYVKKRDVAYKGKKVPDTERVDLFVRGRFYLQFDPEDKFKNSIVWKFRRAFFNRIYYQEIEQHKKNLYHLAMNIQRLVKGALEMEADREWADTSYGKFGYKEWGTDWEKKLE